MLRFLFINTRTPGQSLQPSVALASRSLLLVVLTMGLHFSLTKFLIGQEKRVDESRINFALDMDLRRIRQVEALKNVPPDGKALIDQVIDEYFQSNLDSQYLNRVVFGGSARADAQTGQFQIGSVLGNPQHEFFLRLEFEQIPAQLQLEIEKSLRNAKSIEVDGKITRYHFGKSVVEQNDKIIETKSTLWSGKNFPELLSDDLEKLWQNLPARAAIRLGYHIPRNPNWNPLENLSLTKIEDLTWLQSVHSLQLSIDLDGPDLLKASIETNSQQGKNEIAKSANAGLAVLRQFRGFGLSEIRPKHVVSVNNWFDSLSLQTDDNRLTLNVPRPESLDKLILGFRKAVLPEFVDAANLLVVHLEFNVVNSKKPDEFVIQGNSNLPTGSILDISVQEARPVGSIFGTNINKSVSVRGQGKFEIAVKSPHPLNTGRYDIAVTTARTQPLAVKQRLGEQGERMSGPLVTGDSRKGKQIRKHSAFELRPPLSPEQMANHRETVIRLRDDMIALNEEIKVKLEEGLLRRSQKRRAKTADAFRKKLGAIEKDVRLAIIEHEIATSITACYSQLDSIIKYVDSETVDKSVPRYITVMQTSIELTIEKVVKSLKSP